MNDGRWLIIGRLCHLVHRFGHFVRAWNRPHVENTSWSETGVPEGCFDTKNHEQYNTQLSHVWMKQTTAIHDTVHDGNTLYRAGTSAHWRVPAQYTRLRLNECLKTERTRNHQQHPWRVVIRWKIDSQGGL